MKCGDCKHWFDNGTDYCSCDRDALLRERNFFCAAWERKKPFERPTTNADRIRAMSDEELAHFMTPENYKFPCPPNNIDCQYELIPCWMCWAKWLKTPVEVDDGRL